jgi:LAO/AO transport system kinase
MNKLVDRLCRGDRRALARAMSCVDASGRTEPGLEVRLRESTGRIPWWGFTGPPGAGKSTVIDALLVRLRQQGRRIGVVAVDPSSLRTNGALLGDRVRMMRHAADANVFIRSLAAHGHEGGLSDATLHCARLLELAGYDPVLIETVGVGQNEVEIASVADFCVVVLAPGHGDDIQLIKAGLLEIADLVVVNKCDLPESQRLLNGVRAELAGAALARRGRQAATAAEAGPEATSDAAGAAEVVGVEAKSGRGIDVLVEQLLELDRARRTSPAEACRSQRRVLAEVRRGMRSACGQALERVLSRPPATQWIARLAQGEVALDAVVSQLAALASSEILQSQSNEGKRG